MKGIRVLLAMFGCSLAGLGPVFSQPSNAPRQDFWVTDGPVYTIVETNGVTYIGGSFKSIAPNAGRGGLFNIFSGESASLLPQANGSILSVIPDGAGGWFVGGIFTAIGGVARTNLAHLLADLTVDPAWAPHPQGFVNPTQRSGVYALLLGTNGLYVGGIFTNLGGAVRQNLALLDPVTGTNLTWSGGVGGEVYALAQTSDRLFIGGTFTNVAGQGRTNLAALNPATGAPLSWSASASRPDLGSVNAFAVAGETLYVGGYFDNVSGLVRSNLAAVDVNTAAVKNWSVTTDNGIQALAFSCNKLYCAGVFTNVGGATRRRLAALDAMTAAVLPWNPDADDDAYALLIAGDTVYAGGLFTTIGGTARNSLAAIDANTGLPAPWSPRADRGVLAVALAGNNLFVGGGLSAGGFSRRNLAAFDTATGQPLDWNPGTDGPVYCMTHYNGVVYFGGQFKQAGGVSRRHLASVDAVTGAATSWDPDVAGYAPATQVLSIAQGAGVIYVGGVFTRVGGQTRNCIGALNASSGLATSWAPGILNFPGPVRSLAVDGTKIYAGGFFSSLSLTTPPFTTTRNNIVEFTSTSSNPTTWNPGANDGVYALAVDATNVYAGGDFTVLGGVGRLHAGAVNRSTAATTSWNPGPTGGLLASAGFVPFVTTISVFSNLVYLGGGFDTVRGQSRQALAIVDMALGDPTAFNANLGDLRATILSVSPAANRLTAGGLFVTVGDEVRPGLAAFVEPGFPRVEQPPAPQNVPAGSAALFTTAVSGQPPLFLQWQFNGTNIAGATNDSLAVANVQISHSGLYRVIVSNAVGRATSIDAPLNALLSVTISNHPMSQTVAPGTNVVLSVVAGGNPPPSFQWRLNGVNIPGAVYSTLALTNVQATNSGRYTVLVSGVGGTLESAGAELVVTASALAFADDFAARGTILGVSGVGSGSNAGATEETNEVRHAGKRGGHSVWLSWTAPSNGIAIFHSRGSAFDTLLAVYTNATVSGTNVVASDEDRGGFLTSLLAFNATAGQEYQIAVDGYFGATGRVVLSWSLETTANELPLILVHPVSVTVAAGATATFDVTAFSQSPLTYQWLRDCMPIAGATNSSLILSNVAVADVGRYSVQVSNSGRVSDSLFAALEIGPDSAVLAFDKLEDLLAAAGVIPASAPPPPGKGKIIPFSGPSGTIIVSAGATGSQLLDNNGAVSQPGEPAPCGVPGGASVWYNIRPATNAMLVLDTIGSAIDTVMAIYTGTSFANLTSIACDNNGAPDGIRSLVRFHAAGGTNYLVAIDGVNAQKGPITFNWGLGLVPSLNQPLTNAVGLVGGAMTLSATGFSGLPAPRFQWRLNGVNLAGQTNATLVLTNLQDTLAGTYEVVAVNFVGAVTNRIAVLAVEPVLIGQLGLAGELFQMQFTGVPGASYILEVRPDLAAGPWTPAATNTAAGNGALNFADGPLNGATNRAYRVRKIP